MKRSRFCILFLSAIFCMAVPAGSQPGPAAKGRRQIAPWIVLREEKGFERIERDGTPHLFYASDAESTRAHLETADELDLPGIGFWHFSSVDEPTWQAVREWLVRR